MIIGVETGGTKVVCAAALASSPAEILHSTVIPTADPDSTIAAITAFIDGVEQLHPVSAVGIASFGPVEVRTDSPDFGSILVSPKVAWRGVPILSRVGRGLPSTIVSDVTGAAIGERALGAARGTDNVVYVTVGTGVGVGILVNGVPLVGIGHPEGGHLTVRRHPADRYEGGCPLHGDCLEGLAAGPAVIARWGADPSLLSPEDLATALEIEAFYLAQLLAALCYLVSPERIVLGGGVSKTPGLLGAVRTALAELVAGALGADHPLQAPESGFMVQPGLGDHSGVTGALVLAAGLVEFKAPEGPLQD